MEQYGLYQVTIPLPYWNDSVHCFLGRREGKWTVIDTGMNGYDTRKTWEAAFAAHGINPQTDVEAILLTHHHGDHFGFAGEMQSWTGAKLHLSKPELDLARYAWSVEDFTAFYRSTGLPREMVQELHGHETAFVQPLSPFPEDLGIIEDGDSFQIGELSFEAILMPGHTRGHICYYNRQHKLLISGDHLTKETIPYISYHGYGDDNPLQTYLSTLRNMQNMEISMVLPGHGPVFSDAQERIAELIRHFEARIEAVHALVTHEMTAYEISLALFPTERSVFKQWIDLGETNAYLRYLAEKGELQVREEDGLHRYSR